MVLMCVCKTSFDILHNGLSLSSPVKRLLPAQSDLNEWKAELDPIKTSSSVSVFCFFVKINFNFLLFNFSNKLSVKVILKM